MPKHIPVCPEIPKRTHSDLEKTEYTIQIITPLFGGGVEAGEPDPITPIRGTSIRGQLQFWWRATRGASCSALDELLERHAEIWGTTEKASRVIIEVREVTAVPARSCARYDWNPNAQKGQGGWRLTWEHPFTNSSLPYVLFPFQGKKPASRQGPPEEVPTQFIQTASFILRMRYPETFREDVETAVGAWVNFGGLGARTRRGCGALFCEQLAPKNVNELTNWVKKRAGAMGHPTHEWPTLPDRFWYHPNSQNPIEAWKQVVKLIQEFRQGEGIGRNSGTQSNRPGRSRWPEPETIRKITNHRSSKHPRIQQIPDDTFPRAELGLPLVFHFPPGQGEPPDTILYPANGKDGEQRERMASPLILKPLALANGKAVPLIIRLRTSPLSGVRLHPDTWKLPSTTTVRDAQLATYSNSPLQGAQSGSALEAFLNLAKTRGFHEVTQ